MNVTVQQQHLIVLPKEPMLRLQSGMQAKKRTLKNNSSVLHQRQSGQFYKENISSHNHFLDTDSASSNLDAVGPLGASADAKFVKSFNAAQSNSASVIQSHHQQSSP